MTFMKEGPEGIAGMWSHRNAGTFQITQYLVLDQIILHNNRCGSLIFHEYLTYLCVIL